LNSNSRIQIQTQFEQQTTKQCKGGMNASQTKRPQLIFRKQPIILFSYTKLHLKRINVGKILKL